MTPSQREVIMRLANVLHETAKAAGPNGTPLGPMYAAFNARGISLDVFNQLVQGLVGAGVVKVRHHCLVVL